MKRFFQYYNWGSSGPNAYEVTLDYMIEGKDHHMEDRLKHTVSYLANLTELLIDKGVITEKDVAGIVSEAYRVEGVPHYEVRNMGKKFAVMSETIDYTGEFDHPVKLETIEIFTSYEDAVKKRNELNNA